MSASVIAHNLLDMAARMPSPGVMIQRAVQMEGIDLDVVLRAWTMVEGLDDKDVRDAVLAVWISLAPDAAQPRVLRAQMALAAGDAAAAVALIDAALAHHPDDWHLHSDRAIALCAGGRPDDALAAMARALALADDALEHAVRLGRALAEALHVDAAITLFADLKARGKIVSRLRPEPGLAAAILEGASLYALMTPDPRLPANSPEYLENYQFDTIHLSGDHFWAYPQVFVTDPVHGTLVNLCYPSDTRLVCRFAYGSSLFDAEPGNFIVMPGDAYRDFEFRVRHDHRIIYDSETTTDTAPLAAAIEEGAVFRCAMLLPSGVWHVAPVHLAFFYPGDRSFKLTTELRVHAALTGWPMEALSPLWQTFIDEFDRRTEWNPYTVAMPCDRAWSQFVITSDGRYERFLGKATAFKGRFTRLRIFART